MATHLPPIAHRFDEEAPSLNRNHSYRSKDEPKTIKGHVLLVDDSALSRKVVGKMLIYLGLSLDTANDGSAAVVAVNHRIYDLVIMDIQMPIMDGLEATSAIRRLPHAAKLPIIALTANPVQPIFREKGINDYLAKPTSLNALRTTLLRWLPGVTDKHVGT